MSVKLEPCPFCGSENTDPSFARGEDQQGKPTIGAGCMDCGACGPMVRHPINSTGYKEAAEPWNMRAQLAALKEENDRLKQPCGHLRHIAALLGENDELKARVAELEKASISRSLIISRLQSLPDDHRMNLHDAEIIWGIIESINDGDFDFKEPANEG